MGGTVCMEMKKMLNNDRIKPYLLKARFGVEKKVNELTYQEV